MASISTVAVEEKMFENVDGQQNLCGNEQRSKMACLHHLCKIKGYVKLAKKWFLFFMVL